METDGVSGGERERAGKRQEGGEKRGRERGRTDER